MSLPKYRQRQISDLEKSIASGKRYVIVLKEKHGTRYLDASTVESAYNLCLKVLSQRLMEGWYGSDVAGPKPSEITMEFVERLPEELRSQAITTINLRKHEEKLQADARSERDEIKTAIENRDGMLAYLVLKERSDGEYEGFHLEQIETD